MKNIIAILIAAILIFKVIPSEIENKEMPVINEAVDMMYNEKFEDALAIFSYIRDTYPDHPIGPFFIGYYYNFLASFYETDKFDSKIVLNYNLAEKKADFHLNFNRNDPWLNFYKGASLINRGYLLGRDGKRFSALTKTFDGISYIKICLKHDSDLGDAMLLFGTYLFYKSSLLSWVWDSREKAVETVKDSFDKSYFSRYLAISTLGWIYIDYEKYEKAEKMADLALEKYPGCHLFLFLKARAVFERNDLANAEKLYLQIIDKLKRMEETYSNKDIFNSYYFLARIALKRNENTKFEKYKREALNTTLTKNELNMLEKRLSELKGLESR